MTGDARRPARRCFSRVVLVDFDGVLNDDAWLTAGRGKVLSPPHVHRLDTLARGAGAAVVVVSAWRCFTPLADLRALLAEAGLTAPVLDAVGFDRGPDDGRAPHAAQWLAQHPEIRGWVVLDDADVWKGDLWTGRWVRVDGAVGLTDADAARAAAMLARNAR